MASEKFAAQLDKFVNDKYIPWKQNVKIALGAGLIAVPIVAFFFLFYNPKQEEITGLETKRDALTVEVNKAEAAAANLQHHKDELVKAQQKFEEISVILPKDDQEIPALLRNISDIGKRAGLDLTNFKLGTENPKDFYAEIPFSISIKGPYHNIGYFLGEISGLPRLVTIDNINMGSPQEVAGDMILSSSCNALTYRFTGKAAAPPPGSNPPKPK
jgi:type IV pilus assembly protein PilO